MSARLAAHRATARKPRSPRATRHARTFHHGRGLLDLPLPDRPLPDPDDPKVTHTFSATRSRSRSRPARATGSSDGRRVCIRDPRELRDDDRPGRGEELPRACGCRHYHAAEGVGWGRTAGDVGRLGFGRERFRGQPIDVRDGVVRCLYCHVTRTSAISATRRRRPARAPRPPIPGSAANGATGPAGTTCAAVKADFAGPGHRQHRGTAPPRRSTQCADCHIVGPLGADRTAPEDPRFIRSPGVTMTVSRCYTESGGGMSCLTCHDPHRDAERSAAFYEAKCLSATCPCRQPGRGRAKQAPIARRDPRRPAPSTRQGLSQLPHAQDSRRRSAHCP